MPRMGTACQSHSVGGVVQSSSVSVLDSGGPEPVPHIFLTFERCVSTPSACRRRVASGGAAVHWLYILVSPGACSIVALHIPTSLETSYPRARVSSRHPEPCRTLCSSPACAHTGAAGGVSGIAVGDHIFDLYFNSGRLPSFLDCSRRGISARAIL